MRKGLQFLFPYIIDKKKWPWQPDVMYWEEWPVRHPSLLFSGVNLGIRKYIEAWKRLEADPTTFEVLRNFPLRHPLLWISFEDS